MATLHKMRKMSRRVQQLSLSLVVSPFPPCKRCTCLLTPYNGFVARHFRETHVANSHLAIPNKNNQFKKRALEEEVERAHLLDNSVYIMTVFRPKASNPRTAEQGCLNGLLQQSVRPPD